MIVAMRAKITYLAGRTSRAVKGGRSHHAAAMAAAEEDTSQEDRLCGGATMVVATRAMIISPAGRTSGNGSTSSSFI